eukprot:4073349-Amphidinium_carterae.1
MGVPEIENSTETCKERTSKSTPLIRIGFELWELQHINAPMQEHRSSLLRNPGRFQFFEVLAAPLLAASVCVMQRVEWV